MKQKQKRTRERSKYIQFTISVKAILILISVAGTVLMAYTTEAQNKPLERNKVVISTSNPIVRDTSILSVSERIEKASEGTGWTEILLKLAKCESGYDEFAVNVNRGGSVDLGVLQWNQHYQKDFITPECSLNVECSIAKFFEKVESNPNALSLWVCSDRI